MANEINYPDKMFDRSHASKIFVANNYGLSPKYGWLFHVSFELNPEISRVSNDDLLRMGFVVKSASLPKFSVDTKVLNAYNRVDIVQSKVKYEAVTIKFHDDNLDVIRNFWYDYYSYYYRDADWNQNIYTSPTKYTERQQQGWGYSPRQYPSSSPATQQYINTIKIYSLHNKRFAEYTLINPIITSFQHGEHAQGSESGTLENTVTIQYQAVKYAYGSVSSDTVSGFASLQYDTKPSPMGTTPAPDNTIHDLAEGQTGLPGLLNNFKSLNGKAILGGAISTLGSQILTKGLGGIPGAAGAAGGIAAAAKSFGDTVGSVASKVSSNGLLVGGASKVRSMFGGLPNDANGSTPDYNSLLDNERSTLSVYESLAEDYKTENEGLTSLIEELSATIEENKDLLLEDLSSEDLAALQAAIDSDQEELDSAIERQSELEGLINENEVNIAASNDAIEKYEAAKNPSGNSEADGGAGADSTTQTFDDGSSITRNPDGSSTTVDSDGNITTTPQQNPVSNPNAASNQKIPVFKLSETSNPSNFRL